LSKTWWSKTKPIISLNCLFNVYVYSKKYIKKAFSLVEISIVILVIGIIISGVFQSLSMIRNFKLSSARTLTQSSPVLGIKDLSLWLEATSERSFITSEASNKATISNWYDINDQRTKNRNSVSQLTEASKPIYIENAINGLPAVYFDGVNDVLSKTNLLGSQLFRSNQVTIFIVQAFFNDAYSVPTSFFWGNDSFETRLLIHAALGGTIYFDFGGSGGGPYYRISENIADSFYNKPKVLSFLHDSSNYSEIRINKIMLASDSSITNQLPTESSYNMNIGAAQDNSGPSGFFRGHIGEIIVYDRALTKSERVAEKNYLGQKWGISLENGDDKLPAAPRPIEDL